MTSDKITWPQFHRTCYTSELGPLSPGTPLGYVFQALYCLLSGNLLHFKFLYLLDLYRGMEFQKVGKGAAGYVSAKHLMRSSSFMEFFSEMQIKY